MNRTLRSINDLPPEMIEIIQSFLPARDAARTSILLRTWRHCWAGVPKLVFDEVPHKFTLEQLMHVDRKVIEAIYQVLSLHRGPVLEFNLTMPFLPPCFKIEQSFSLLSRKGVKKIVLYFYVDLNLLPSSLFSCLQLSHLNISRCRFEPPQTFEGFKKLVTLTFNKVRVNAQTFGSFISSCPLLERLTLISSNSFHFEIDAPRLKFLRLGGVLGSFCFKNTPLLASVVIKWPIEVKLLKVGETQRLHMEIFGCLPVLEKLQLEQSFVQSMAMGGVPKKLHTALNALKELELPNIAI